MPASAVGSRLSGLRFIDPQDDPGWSHVVVSGEPGPEPAAATRAVDVAIAGAGRTWGLDEWVEETWSTSLLVLDRAAVVHEWYAAGLGPHTRFLGASMSKSALAHLVGRAVTAGELRLDDPVCTHVPELRGTGYDGTRLIDVLTMTSGVDWVEDHRDPDSLASRLLGCFADGSDSRRLLGSVPPGVRPGTRFAYCTADSQVLDWVRERATGRPFADALALLWADLGCTGDAVVGVDGTAAGRPVLDGSWVDAAARPTYPFLAPGRLPSTITAHAGFGFHWWPLDEGGRRLAADGSRGQLAAADRRTGTVVVKTSRWPYDDAWADRHYRDLSYLGLHTLLDTTPLDRTTEGEATP